jgi:hypothetical protein
MEKNVNNIPNIIPKNLHVVSDVLINGAMINSPPSKKKITAKLNLTPK